jgi:2,5-diketo-D-gluconate reductase A
VQLGVLPIPKSATPARQVENLGVEDFQLDDSDMAAIAKLTRVNGRLFDGDPRTHEEF